MKGRIATAVSLYAAAAAAANCRDLQISVTPTARTAVFDVAIPRNEIEVSAFVLNQFGQQGVNYSAEVTTGYTTLTKEITLAATYCEPDSGPSSAIQILTHGIGFDRSYWNVPFNNYNYSYSAEAVDQYGFSTLAYDRPGIGQSTHLNPLSESQAIFEVQALYQLTLLVQGGKIPGIPTFQTITHAGHSFGAEHTYLLTALYPDISDCITLQGFSQNGSFVPYFALGSNLVEARTIAALKDYPDGYFANGTPQSVEYDFFSPGDFDPRILNYAVRTGKPVTIGELLTIGGETATPNTFAGPVHIVTGNRDIPYCGGNCDAPPTGYPNIPSTSAQFLPNASPFKVDIIPGAGHGLNLEYSHTLTYSIMLDFLVQNGCGPSSAPGHYGH